MKNNNDWIVPVVGIIALFAFLAFSIVTLFPTGISQRHPGQFTIQVTATGTAYALPGQIEMALSVNGTGATPAGNSAVTPGNITVYTSPIVGYPSFLNAASAAPVFYNSQAGVPEQISATFYRS